MLQPDEFAIRWKCFAEKDRLTIAECYAIGCLLPKESAIPLLAIFDTVEPSFILGRDERGTYARLEPGEKQRQVVELIENIITSKSN